MRLAAFVIGSNNYYITTHTHTNILHMHSQLLVDPKYIEGIVCVGSNINEFV